jgi:hypothetical protein
LDKVLSLLSGVADLLEEDFSEAESRMETLKTILEPSEYKSEYTKLASQIDGYDFDGAVETIDELTMTIEKAAKKEQA